MGGGPDNIRLPAQLHNPSKITDMQNGSLVIAGDQSVELPGPRSQMYATPPSSTAETGSSSSSQNRGQLRAASQSTGSPGGQAFSDFYPSFGAGVRNVPNPILTRNPPRSVVTVDQDQMREHFSREPLQFIGNMLRGSNRMPEVHQDSCQNYPFNEVPQIAPRPFHSQLSQGGDYLEQRQNGHSMHDEVFPVANPYTERADEIGPSHYIPGVRHLGGLLTPPGWNEGDEPIDPQAAKMLYHAAQREARTSFKAGFDETEQLEPDEKEKRRAYLDSLRNSREQLDRTLYNERVTVYLRAQKRKLPVFRPEKEQSQDLPSSIVLEPPQPINPPATTTYAMTVNRPFPRQPNLYREPTWVDASYPAPSRSDARFHRAPPSIQISPSLLDPSLVPQTLETVHKKYQDRKAEIDRMKEENDRNLASWINSFGPHLSQEQLSPGILPPDSNQRARPFYSSRNGNSSSVPGDQHARSVPRPPQYVSPTREPFDAASNFFEYPEYPTMEPPKPISYHPAIPGLSMPLDRRNNQEQGREWQIVAEGNGNEIRNDLKTSINEAKGSKNLSPKSKGKRVPKEKVEKPPVWYADELRKRDMPTTRNLDPEALQAGLDYNVNGPKIEKAEKAKKSSPARRRRGGKLEFDPFVGIPVSEEAAELLIANGAPDRRNAPVPVSSGAAQLSTSNSAGVPSVPNGLSAYSSPYHPIPAERSNFVFPGNTKSRASSKSEVSSDLSDDPKDGDYECKATRQKYSTPRKLAADQTTPRSSSKRKSDDALETNKRYRSSMDGHNDTSNYVADGTNGLGG